MKLTIIWCLDKKNKRKGKKCGLTKLGLNLEYIK